MWVHPKVKHPRITFQPKVFEYIYRRDRQRCGLCGKHVERSEWCLDHRLPLGVGGTNNLSNLQLTHHGCNSKRNWRGAAQLAFTFPAPRKRVVTGPHGYTINAWSKKWAKHYDDQGWRCGGCQAMFRFKDRAVECSKKHKEFL